MYFTKQDYERILSYILDHSKKDTEFENATSISGQELLSVVQEGVNRNIELGELLRIFDEHGIEIKVRQDEGDSTSVVMSQKAVTDALTDLRDVIDLDADKGTVQHQIDVINNTIGGAGSESIQNQLVSLRDTKLQRGLESQGGDLVDNLSSTKSTKALTANQGRILQEHIDDIGETVDTFIHSTIEDRGMAVSVSNNTLKLEFTSSQLDTIYVQQVGGVLSLTNTSLA